MAYVICRPFRDAQGMLLAGTYVEPALVRAFKVRLQDKHIREVTEENFDDIASFLHGRFGVTLKAIPNVNAPPEVPITDNSDDASEGSTDTNMEPTTTDSIESSVENSDVSVATVPEVEEPKKATAKAKITLKPKA